MSAIDGDYNNAASRVNTAFEQVNVIVPFSVYKDYTEGRTLTVQVNDMMHNPRLVRIPDHIERLLSAKVFSLIKENIPFELRAFHINCATKTAPCIIKSLTSTTDVLGQTKYDTLAARLSKLKLNKLADWPNVRAEFVQLLEYTPIGPMQYAKARSN